MKLLIDHILCHLWQMSIHSQMYFGTRHSLHMQFILVFDRKKFIEKEILYRGNFISNNSLQKTLDILCVHGVQSSDYKIFTK